MISEKTLKALEFNKIMANVAEFAVLEQTKGQIRSFAPLTTLSEVENLLKHVDEAYKYLFTYSSGGIYYFSDVTESLKRVDIGGVLNNVELLRIAANLKSARIIKDAINSVGIQENDINIVKNNVRKQLANYFFKKMKRRPLILTIISEN